jgi:hypothetical protein
MVANAAFQQDFLTFSGFSSNLSHVDDESYDGLESPS